MSHRHPVVHSSGRIPVEQLSQHLGVCDAFVLPLRDTVFNRTRWPNKLGDYVAAGRPVLCSNVGDVAEIMRKEGCGIVWNDLSELKAGIDRLAENGAVAREMGNRARAVAEGPAELEFHTSNFADATVPIPAW